MKFFGPDWVAEPIIPRCPTPVGEECFHCKKEIESRDQGFIAPHTKGWKTDLVNYHKVCFDTLLFGAP